MKAFEVVKAIREEWGGMNERKRKNFLSMAETLANDLYKKDMHFIFELIQNAEDNEYHPEVQPKLRFEISMEEVAGKPNTVLSVHNNEVGFQEEHVDAICQFGNSSKKKRPRDISVKKGSASSRYFGSHPPHTSFQTVSGSVSRSVMKRPGLVISSPNG
ncbi:MAG: hypothetical protein V1782_10585 [Pseudomonadota bacterium]